MVLDARDNNALGRFSNLPDVFNRNQTLKLEGNFNNYFTLYAPAEYARDALYVFTPDVMAALIDSGSKYDLEVMDNSLWIYSKGRFDMNEPTLRQLLKIADTIGGELGDQSAGYVDERVGDRSANIVAAPGKRLKKSINLIKVFKIAESASKTEQRKIFKEAMLFVEKKDVKNLIVEKVDRHVRNLHDAVETHDWLTKDETRKVHFVKDAIVLHKNSRSQEWLNWGMRVVLAKNYIDNLREEAMKGWAEKLAQGWMPAPATNSKCAPIAPAADTATGHPGRSSKRLFL
jgi:hypothetical protein